MQTDRPVIGICSPTAHDLAYNRQCAPQYAEAVRAAGGEAREISLELTPRELQVSLEVCAGFILPGSPADIDPAGYGEIRDAATAEADPVREGCDRSVLEHAERTGKPVLGICFGLQSLNTWRGGSLVQDLSPLPVNHAAGSSVATAHTVLIANVSLLGSLLSNAEAPGDGPFRRLTVNSSHHQAVSRPGYDLTVVARASEDGTVEALEGRVGEAAMLGVQWHPERSTEISSASRNLFAWLVLSAADVLEAPGETSREAAGGDTL